MRAAVSVSMWLCMTLCVFFNDTATTEIYTLSLHDALPISCIEVHLPPPPLLRGVIKLNGPGRSEEHTSELQSHLNLVCRLLLDKKHIKRIASPTPAPLARSPTPRRTHRQH